MITLDDVLAARETISDAVHRTPVFTSRRLGDRLGVELWHKAELFQKTGCFKPRGALNRLRNATAEERERGFVTVSAGNHAQGLAWAAGVEGVAATVVMHADAHRSKVDACRAYGAEVVCHGTIPEAFERMEEIRAERDLVLVHPFDDPLVVAGQGTVGLEIVEQVPDVDVVVCPVGGGGLVSGVALAVKARRPDVRLYGVEPQGAAAMRASWDAGEPVRLEAVDTIVDSLAAPYAGAIAYEVTRTHLSDVVTLSDHEIVAGLREVLVSAKLYAEPAGAAATAALLAGRVPVREGERVVSVVSGGNVDPDRLAALLG